MKAPYEQDHRDQFCWEAQFVAEMCLQLSADDGVEEFTLEEILWRGHTLSVIWSIHIGRTKRKVGRSDDLRRFRNDFGSDSPEMAAGAWIVNDFYPVNAGRPDNLDSNGVSWIGDL